MTQRLSINEYSFHEFLVQFQRAVLQGYRLNLDTNETFPQKYGDHLSVILEPPEEVSVEKTAITQVSAESNTEEPKEIKPRKGILRKQQQE